VDLRSGGAVRRGLLVEPEKRPAMLEIRLDDDLRTVPRPQHDRGDVESPRTENPRTTAPDRTLLDAVASGDRVALRALYERHAPWLVIRLARRCTDPGIVEEVAQDTFLAVWNGARRFRGEGDVAAWIWGIGVRRLIDRLRGHPLPIPIARAEPGLVVSAEEEVLLGVEHGDLATALNELSPELRAVMQATVLDGLTTREAARLLGIPQGTVKTRLMRARQELREALA
jgi:RNA polymerase sigma-70 factor (ECF subfamily)